MYQGNENILSKENFAEMSPFLIWISTECRISKNEDDEHDEHEEHEDDEDCKNNMIYLYGAVAIIIIWLVSFVCVIFVGKFKLGKKYIIIALSSLAIGTLLSDALLHIIPTVRIIKLYSSSKR